jgi:hypothetical protein
LSPDLLFTLLTYGVDQQTVVLRHRCTCIYIRASNMRARPYKLDKCMSECTIVENHEVLLSLRELLQFYDRKE